jgi:hypothetical protein
MADLDVDAVIGRLLEGARLTGLGVLCLWQKFGRLAYWFSFSSAPYMSVLSCGLSEYIACADQEFHCDLEPFHAV